MKGYYGFPLLRELAFSIPPLLFFREKALEVLESHLPPTSPQTILDVGCGTGMTTRRLARRYPSARILGVDLSEEMIQVARDRTAFSNVVYRVADVRALSGRFDRVVAFFVWMLLPPGSLEDLKRLLGEEGQAFLVLTSPTWFTRLHRAFFQRVAGAPLILWEPERWVRESRRVGLEPSVYPAHGVEGSFLLVLRRQG